MFSSYTPNRQTDGPGDITWTTKWLVVNRARKRYPLRQQTFLRFSAVFWLSTNNTRRYDTTRRCNRSTTVYGSLLAALVTATVPYAQRHV